MYLNLQKSAQALLGHPTEAPEQIDSWALPGKSQCNPRTINTKLIVWSPRWLWTAFSITLGFLLVPFLGPWAPKWRPGGEQVRLQKTHEQMIWRTVRQSAQIHHNFVVLCVQMRTPSRVGPGAQLSCRFIAFVNDVWLMLCCEFCLMCFLCMSVFCLFF
jgi:hypothetical protein